MDQVKIQSKPVKYKKIYLDSSEEIGNPSQYDLQPKETNDSKNTIDLRDESVNTCKESFKLGNCIAFCYRDGDPVFTIGPHWEFFICQFIITQFTSLCFVLFVWKSIGTFVRGLAFACWFVQIYSSIYTFIINPGIPSRNLFIGNESKPKVKNYRLCIICSKYMDLDLNTNHCNECGVCVEGYDHHCPWTSKCVGKGNLKSFKIFLFSSIILIITMLCIGIGINLNYKRNG